MGGVVYQNHSVFHFPTFSSFNKQLKIGDNPIFSLRDIADVSLPFEKLKVSCNASEERDRRGQSSRRSTGARRAPKNDEAYKPRKGGRKSKSSGNQEEIISLFRRIQSSISDEVESSTKKIKSDPSDASEETPPSSESILRVLQGGSTRRKEVKLEGKKVDLEVQQLQANPSVTDAKLSRPPSKFVKRSPIPSSSYIASPPGELLESKFGASVTAVKPELASERVEGMKLPELKELAKSRGIRVPSKKIKSDASDASEEMPPSSESTLRVLQGGSTVRKEVNLERQKVEPELQQLQANPPVTDAKLTRPPSKFVKRSPIPSSSYISSPPGDLLDTKIGASVTAVEPELASEKVEDMKLPELKVLAKSRGIRGYSTEKGAH